MIFVAENSTKFQKTKFWKEKSVEDVITLEPTANATLVANEATTLSSKVFSLSNVTKFRPLKNIKEYSVANSLLKFFFGQNPFTNDGNFSCITKLKKKRERTLKLTHSTPCVHEASKRIEVL
jgi:hypothetical protein